MQDTKRLVKFVFFISLTLFLCNFLISENLHSAINQIKQIKQIRIL